MGGNRRFRGMKHPAAKGYSRLPTMEGHRTKKARAGREGLFYILAVLGLCFCILAVGAFFLLKYSFTINSENYESPSTTDGYPSTSFLTHVAQTLTSEELVNITGLPDIERLFSEELSETSPLLNTRVPGTPGNERARNYIISQLTSQGIWDIETDDFDDRTPHGMKNFVNIIATLRPRIKRRLVIACHYDSKYFAPRTDGRVFVGATDSGVPCAMMLDLGRNLADLLSSTTQVSTSLQLIFFDGEEAFDRWTDTDSLYGSRHLAAKMQDTPHPKKTSITSQLDAMDMFILLDLIGTPNPIFRNFFPSTTAWFGRLVHIEAKLKSLGSISARSTSYFDVRLHRSGIGDDHEPFYHRGVDRIIHLIAYPFPSVWHTVDDNRDALDKTTVDDLNKILHVFVAEYLHLLDSQPARAG